MNNLTPAQTLAALARAALMAQDACNPLGLARSFAEDLKRLERALEDAGQPCGTDAICQHPIFRLWASKFHDMARMGLSDLDRYHEACQAATDLMTV